MSDEKPINLGNLDPLVASILRTAIIARIEDLEAYRDTWSISESLVLLDLAKKIPEGVEDEETSILETC